MSEEIDEYGYVLLEHLARFSVQRPTFHFDYSLKRKEACTREETKTVAASSF